MKNTGDVLIRGMELPESCWSCRMFCNCFACEGHNCRCAALDKAIGEEKEILRNKRRDDCPLVPVPPHGRLIDADELHSALRKRAKEFSNSEYGEGVKCGLADAREYIKIAPTIIPAEEGET